MNIQFTRSAIFSILAISFIITLASCTSKYAFQTSPTVPAARGDVKVKKDGNNNYLIKVSVSNLAEVKRLQQGKESYVVWMVSDEDVTKNLGQINSSSSMLSSKLKASFQAVSSAKPHRIFITAEENGATTYPGNTIILSTDKF
jgi:anti-sigma-K factor RskA